MLGAIDLDLTLCVPREYAHFPLVYASKTRLSEVRELAVVCKAQPAPESTAAWTERKQEACRQSEPETSWGDTGDPEDRLFCLILFPVAVLRLT